MSGIRKAFTSLLCIGLLLGIANQAFSFEYLGYKYFSLPVSFYFNSSGSDDIPGDSEFQALTAAFNTWQNVSGSAWTWSYQGTTSQGYYSGFDGNNVCEWIESDWPYGWGAIAVCHIIADDDIGEVLDTDIAFNGEDFEWSIGGSGMDIQNIATHEIGHTLVLDDLYSAADREKTMYGRASKGETKKRTLEQDDMNGIRYIYPGTKPTPPPTPVPPAAPSNLAATAISSTQINFSWQDNSDNETGFKIERKTGASGSWAEIATVATNVTTYDNTGLTAGTTYYYRVRSYNSAGNSSYSNEANATTTAPTPTPTPTPTPFLLGDVSGDGEISAYDAALTAQASVGLITLTAEQTKAADVSGNNEVSAYDAALIAQRAVGLIDKFPVE